MIINKNGINEYDDMDYNLPSVFPKTLPDGARVVEFHYTYYRAYTSGEGYLEMTFATADELDAFVNGYKQEMADKKADGAQLLEIVNPFDSGYVDFVEYTKKQDDSLFINNRFEKGVCSTNSKSISLNAQYTVMSYSYEEKTVIITYYSTAFF